MNFKVYDVVGNQQDLAYLDAQWGVTFEEIRFAGKPFFQLVELREVEGPSEYPVLVLDKNGAPWSGRFVGRFWPGAPNEWPGGQKPDNIPAPAEALEHVHFAQTDTTGTAHFGIGDGDYAGPGQGVTSLWIGEHDVGTDVVKKMGMKPNTVHRVLKLTLRYIEVSPEPEPEPIPEPTGDSVVDDLTAARDLLLAIQSGAIIQRIDAALIKLIGGIPSA